MHAFIDAADEDADTAIMLATEKGHNAVTAMIRQHVEAQAQAQAQAQKAQAQIQAKLADARAKALSAAEATELLRWLLPTYF